VSRCLDRSSDLRVGEAACEKRSENSSEVVVDFIGADSSDEYAVETGVVKTNLQAGKIRLVFLADKIPTELQRIVEFLNTQMDPAEVIAVELRQFVGEGVKTLVPRVFGQTATAIQKISMMPSGTQTAKLLIEKGTAPQTGQPSQLLFPANTLGLLILPQPYKFRMSEMTIRCPFRKFNLRHELRFKPSAILHLLFR
jgi:hypothetical protein